MSLRACQAAASTPGSLLRSPAPHLAAMESLVGGLAHEVNNPLACTLSGIGFVLEVAAGLRERIRRGDPPRRDEALGLLGDVIDALEDAQEGGRRISRIVRDMATIGRPDPRRARVRLIDVVDGALSALGELVADRLSVQVVNLGAPDVTGSSEQLERMLASLLANAASATPDPVDGEVGVRLGPGPPGMARLEVIDEGSGIDPAILDRIFEPFFTTREAGKGMGLGLAIAHAIVSAHGGKLAVESTRGKGSTFRVDLPAAGADA
jgi:two-component system NtrC family sensor kinase